MESEMDFDYKVEVTPDTEIALAKWIEYLVEVKQSIQAADNVLTDYDETLERLSTVAASLKLCENDKLAARGLRKIHFEEHRYILLYYLDGDKAVVTNMFHELEDYEEKIK